MQLPDTVRFLTYSTVRNISTWQIVTGGWQLLQPVLRMSKEAKGL